MMLQNELLSKKPSESCCPDSTVRFNFGIIPLLRPFTRSKDRSNEKNHGSFRDTSRGDKDGARSEGAQGRTFA